MLFARVWAIAPLLSPDEGRNAEVAREMKRLGVMAGADLQRDPVSRQAGLLLQSRRPLPARLRAERMGRAPAVGARRPRDS